MNLKFMELIYTLLKSYRQSLDTDSRIRSLMNFENANEDRVVLIL